MLVWVIGAGGLLGSSVTEAARDAGADVFPATPIAWESPAAAQEALEDNLRAFAYQADGRPWSVAWCAGSTVVASSDEQAEAEFALLDGFLVALSAATPSGPGVFFLASSAGGVYAGSAEPPFDAQTPPVPVSPYGHLKLRQERAVEERLRGHVPVVLGRLSNLYGPRTNPGKGQGLIPLLCRATVHRRALNLYVSMDTLRDYLYADDAGELVWGAIEDAQGSSATARIVVLASGEATTVARVVATVQNVAHRRVPIALGTHPSSHHQVVDLRLVPSPLTGQAVQITPLATGIKRVLDTVASDARR